MSTHARSLAEWLAASSDDVLADLFRARGVRADAAWHDFFDVAEALLEASALHRFLPGLTLAEAEALRAAASGEDAGDQRDALTSLALLHKEGSPYPPVAAAALERPAPPHPLRKNPAPANADASAHAAEQALTTISAVADVLLQAIEKPLVLLAGGGVSAGEKKTFIESGAATESIDALVRIAVDAGLLARTDKRLVPTDRTDLWLRSSVAERWSALVSGFRGALPRGVRSSTGGWIPTSAWPDAHPWDPSWPERSASLTEMARLLGVIANNDSEPAWSISLREGSAPDAQTLTALLPAEVDRIFLQNDLTAISPGPLAPALDVRLRTIAERESAAQASSYRFTPESVSRGVSAGESEQSILDFLGAMSLTGIPQPLAYLVAQTAQRHGLVRVMTDAETGRTRVESPDHHLLEAIAVDQALRPLALTAHEGAITTRVNPDTVYWALIDARYPAALVDAYGIPASGGRAHTPAPAQAAPDYSTLIAALREHQDPDADAAWLDRELEAAVRTRSLLKVTVGMPDGSTRELTIEATGLGGGRLRGRDRAADVERTLPVSSIRSAAIVSQ